MHRVRWPQGELDMGENHRFHMIENGIYIEMVYLIMGKSLGKYQ